jgi:hypothetical protein
MKNNEATLEPAAITAMLRNNVFNLKIEDIGLTHAKSPLVWGVMMELGYPDLTISLVAMADGSCSVYLTDGTGAVGCGLYSEVRQMAANMLNIAQRMLPRCEHVDQFPLPADSRAQFYLLTGEGIFSAEASRHELDEGAVDIAELYYAGHNVIGMIELLGAGIDIVDEMRLAQSELNRPATDTSGTHSTTTTRLRGRTWQILPSVGNAARRWHN